MLHRPPRVPGGALVREEAQQLRWAPGDGFVDVHQIVQLLFTLLHRIQWTEDRDLIELSESVEATPAHIDMNSTRALPMPDESFRLFRDHILVV